MKPIKIAALAVIFALILASGCTINLWEPSMPANQTQQPAQTNTGQPTSLYITSAPPGANVYINRGFRGLTPLTIPGIAPGTVELWVTTGTEENKTNITIAANQATSIHVRLAGIQPLNPQTQAVPATPGTGGLEVNSTPADAFVYIDGVYTGRTPLTIQGLPPGGHELKVSSSNYLEFKITILTEADKTQALSPTLEPKGTFGTLKIDTNPSNAEVSLSGSFQGMTPFQKIYPGNNTFTVQLRKPGYITYTENVTVRSGQTRDLSTTLTPTNDTAVVILESTPAGADVYVSDDSTKGTLRGQSPQILYLDTPLASQWPNYKSYKITATRQGYHDCAVDATVYRNTQKRITMLLVGTYEPPGECVTANEDIG